MGKFGKLSVEVKVFESKMKPSPTANGGVYQTIGNCHASIGIDTTVEGQEKSELVLFANFSGRVSRLFNSVEDFDAGKDARLIIDYSNSYKNSNSGKYVEQTLPSPDFQAILEVETMKAFKDGFSKSERDENTAKAAGMELKDYTELMNEALATANKVEGELQTPEAKEGAEKSEIDQLDSEIG
jgi:hypothetical protein